MIAAIGQACLNLIFLGIGALIGCLIMKCIYEDRARKDALRNELSRLKDKLRKKMSEEELDTTRVIIDYFQDQEKLSLGSFEAFIGKHHSNQPMIIRDYVKISIMEICLKNGAGYFSQLEDESYLISRTYHKLG
jgi:hypothetical protein